MMATCVQEVDRVLDVCQGEMHAAKNIASFSYDDGECWMMDVIIYEHSREVNLHSGW